MYNITMVVKSNESKSDIIKRICLSERLDCNDHFAFSCIMIKESEETYKLKINCLQPFEDNPYTMTTLIDKLFEHPGRNAKYVVPPLKDFFVVFAPSLHKMVHQLHPRYCKLIPDKEDLFQTLSLVIVNLYNKGYYIHKRLIYKSFVNELNMQIRKSKYYTNIKSLDEPIGMDAEGNIITYLDKLECPKSSLVAYGLTHYTDNDYWDKKYEQLEKIMLKDMGKFQFDRIMIQIKTKTIDSKTSRILSKYREMFSPDYIPRPNAKGKAKRGTR